MAEQDRTLILEMLTPDERYTALMDAVAVKGWKERDEMITVEIKHENNNGKEFGYGVYVNGYITDDAYAVDGYWDGGQGIYASECVSHGPNAEKRLKAAERRVKRTAMRRYKKECVG